ncbi:MAG: glycosyltransferase family 2 protein [Synechococcales bacterium]|nr:glycosyltransferase family 2 protein [Synechococcales bacterium]
MTKETLLFSIIIPAYNEEAGIQSVITDLATTLQPMQGQYEMIVVNDGSRDRTRELLRELKTRQLIPSMRVIDHPQNLGYGAALKTGIRLAKAPLMVITDADGSYPNEQIPHLVQICKDFDMVVGARIGDQVTYPLLRKIPKWFLVRFAEWITGSKIPDLNSGLRVFKKRIAQRFLPILPDTFSFTTSITIAMLTNRYAVHYEAIDYHPRLGHSKIKPIQDTLRFIQLILRIGVYFAPLKVFLPFAVLAFFGFLTALGIDIFVRRDLTERTLLLLIAWTQTAMFALLADMIDKRTKRP